LSKQQFDLLTYVTMSLDLSINCTAKF